MFEVDACIDVLVDEHDWESNEIGHKWKFVSQSPGIFTNVVQLCLRKNHH